MSVNEYLAVLDRYIISKKEELESGITLSVKVSDGYILIENVFDEENNKTVTRTFYSEFDGELDIPFKKILESELKGGINK